MAESGTKKLRPAGEGRVAGKEESKQILTAAEEGDIDTLVSLSHRGIDITTAHNRFGETVLHKACAYGCSYMVSCILSTGMPVDGSDNDKHTALHCAAVDNKVDCIKLLCDSGATVDAKNKDGRMPLHWAAFNGCSKAVHSLVAGGATVDVMDKNGYTPLADAVRNGHGHGDIVKTLIKHKADPTKVPQEYQQKMKELVREEEEKTRVSADKDTNVGSSSHDPQQDQQKREEKPLTADQERKHKELVTKDQGEKSLTADQERKAFQLAMRDGVSNSLSFRLCVFGPENSGKTCLVDTLFDDIFQQQEATKGADVHICTIYATNWQKCTPQQMADNIQSQFFHGLNISAKQQVESPSFQATTAARKTGFLSKFRAVLFRSNPSGSSQLHEAPEVKLEEIKQAKAIKIVSEKEFTAIVWDFAGQIQYLSTHTVFVRRDNVVFIVFKASCHLSDLIKARPGDEDSASSCKPTTYFHVIHYWLQTVTSVCHDTSGPDHMSEFLPTAVLIATHIDEIIGDLEQAKEAIVAQLAWELEGKPYAKHLAGNLPGVGLLNALRKFCIFLSNKVRDENVITQLKEIVLQISAPSMKEKLPLIYLKIEKELLLLRKEVITTKEFHEVAVENGFMAKENSVEMKGALDHFHQKGVILHFPSIDSLKQLVFLSPQWLEKLIAFLVIAHHYKPMGDKDDHSYRRLKHEGVLVGSFLLHSLEMFNKFHKVIGCEISFNQAIAFLTKFGFIAEISITTEFLEESHPWSEEETRIFIVPSQLPEGKGERKSLFAKEKRVWSISFAFIDGFIPLTIFHQMIATCINWNESRKQNIVWLQKYEIMMVLNHGQYYSVSLCEEKSTIQVDIILGKSMKKSAENRKQLIEVFQTTLEKICHDIIPASSKPIPYIQCPHCDQAHLKLRNLLEEREMFCNMVPVHQDYYQDLFRECQVADKSKQLNEDTQPVNRTTSSENTTAAISMETNPQQFQQAACSDREPEKMTRHTPLAASTATTTSSTANDSVDYQLLDPENLTCPVCYQLYKNPKCLPCYHSYCEECLEKMQVESRITCPECRNETIIPAGGVKELPANFYINRIMDKLGLKCKPEDEELKCDECSEIEPVVAYCVNCKSNLCQFCCENHKRSKRFHGHGIVSLIHQRFSKNVTIQPEAMALMCKEHDLELLLYCETCEHLVCKHCVAKGHHGHDYTNARMKICKCQIELEKVTTSAAEEVVKNLSEARDTTDKLKKKEGSLATEKNFILSHVIPVDGPHQINCDGQSGGYFVWNDCGLEINFPPKCSQQHIQVTTSTFLPIRNEIHASIHIVSAVYQFKCNIERFDEAFTLRLQHCIELQSPEDCQNMRFIIQHNDSNDVKYGHFEIGNSYGTVSLNKFCRIFIVWIRELWRSICTIILPVTDSQGNASLQVSSNQQSSTRSEAHSEELSTSQTDHTTLPQSASGQQLNSSVSSSSGVSSCDIRKEHTKIKLAASPVYKYESMIGLPRDYCYLTDWSSVYSIYVKLGGWRKVSKESIQIAGDITNFPINYYAHEIKFDADGVAIVTCEKAPEATIFVNCWPYQIKKEDVDENYKFYVDQCGKDPLCIRCDNILSAAVRKSVIRVTKTDDAPPSNCQLIIKGIKPHQKVDLCTRCFTKFDPVDSQSTSVVNGGPGPVLVASATGSVRKPVDGAVVFSQIQNKDDVPSMRDLNRYVVHKCASEWEDIAFELGLDKQVEIIKKDNRECKDCLRRTLQKWLDSSTPPATWKTLEVAITNAKRAQLFLDPVCDVYASEERGVKRRISSIQSGSSDEQATKISKT